MMTTPRALLWGALIMASESAAGHPGGLDANGCHHDRVHGGYHCHRGSAAAPTSPPNFAPRSSPNERLRDDRNDSTYYANCSAARAAGAAPVRRGDPGYGRHLDRDGDGVGCE